MTTLEKMLVWGSTVAVTLTGVVYAAMKYLLEPSEPWAVINHPLQPLLLKLHILTAPVLIFGIGMISLRHIWPHFQAGLKRGRRSGIGSALLTVPMILTGYAIQALTDVTWLSVVGYVHLGLGLVFAAGALAHALATHRRNGKATSSRNGNASYSEDSKRIVSHGGHRGHGGASGRRKLSVQ